MPREFSRTRRVEEQLRRDLAEMIRHEIKEPGLGIVGDSVLLVSRASATARLYSIAVHPDARGRGVGRALLAAAESAAWENERAWIRAEIRKDNRASISLFESEGYRRFGEYDGQVVNRWTQPWLVCL